MTAFHQQAQSSKELSNAFLVPAWQPSIQSLCHSRVASEVVVCVYYTLMGIEWEDFHQVPCWMEAADEVPEKFDLFDSEFFSRAPSQVLSSCKSPPLGVQNPEKEAASPCLHLECVCERFHVVCTSLQLTMSIPMPMP